MPPTHSHEPFPHTCNSHKNIFSPFPHFPEMGISCKGSSRGHTSEERAGGGGCRPWAGRAAPKVPLYDGIRVQPGWRQPQMLRSVPDGESGTARDAVETRGKRGKPPELLLSHC